MRRCQIPSFLHADVDADVIIDMDANISTNMDTDVDVSADMDDNMDADIILAHFWKSHTDITSITCNKSKFSSKTKSNTKFQVFTQQ